jgi:hypothetical protein
MVKERKELLATLLWDGKGHANPQAWLGIFGPDPAIVYLNRPLRNRQTETYASADAIAGMIQAEKGFENGPECIARDAGPIIADRHGGICPRTIRLPIQRDIDGAAFRRVPDGIADNIFKVLAPLSSRRQPRARASTAQSSAIS